MLTAAAPGVATDWRTAILQAAALLEQSGATSREYGPRCVQSAEELGPYFVLSPGIALAHARADDMCQAAGLSLLRLEKPVAFGHYTNDPVDLVFCLASPDNEAHMAGLRAFALAMADGLETRLREAAPEELPGLLAEVARR